MTAILWPLVALVAVVLAFVVALKFVERSIADHRPIVDRIDRDIARLGEAFEERLNVVLARANEQAKKLEELENRIKVIDGRTAPPVRGVR